ncbi:unnamed protein product, partial [Ixodes pacificus]
VREVLDDLGVATRVRDGGRRQRGAGVVASAFHTHALHLSLLGLRELRRDDYQAQVDHEEGPDLQESLHGQTHHNEQNKINPVPKGMCILDVVHDVGPALQANH